MLFEFFPKQSIAKNHIAIGFSYPIISCHQ